MHTLQLAVQMWLGRVTLLPKAAAIMAPMEWATTTNTDGFFILHPNGAGARRTQQGKPVDT